MFRLTGLKSLSDAAAEILGKHEGGLWLCGLTSLSDAAAKAFASQQGDILFLTGLTTLSDAAAESLSKRFHDNMDLSGLTTLSDAAAKSLSNHCGSLHLTGLTDISDAAAESLSKHRGLNLGRQTSLSETAAIRLIKSKRAVMIKAEVSTLENQAESSQIKTGIKRILNFLKFRF